jgi:hypothetical protein
MKKNIIIHTIVSLITLFFLFALEILNNYRIDTKLNNKLGVRFDLMSEITTSLKLSILFIASVIPLLIGIYFSYVYAKKNDKKYLFSIFIPLLGALFIPVSFYIYASIINDNWTKIGAALLIIANLIIYIVNEILLFINLKKLKSS